VVWAGGINRAADTQALRDMGICAVFGPASPTSATVEFLRGLGEQQSSVAGI
jgi:methylmalonyl-CoA mutase cobalamin-binding subunit